MRRNPKRYLQKSETVQPERNILSLGYKYRQSRNSQEFGNPKSE